LMNSRLVAAHVGQFPAHIAAVGTVVADGLPRLLHL
jgi:hypothetical protein